MPKTYDQQTGKFLATIAQSMPEVSVDAMQGWIENPKGLKEALMVALCPMMGATTAFNPHTYFSNRDGLYIYDSFERRILLKSKRSMPHRGLEGVTNSMLARSMSNNEIIDEILGGTKETRKHAFTLDQIAAKIDLQPNGKDGDLLNNGYANIFYVLVGEVLFAVRVHWDSGYRGWLVRDLHLDENDGWNAGSRVFRNTTLAV